MTYQKTEWKTGDTITQQRLNKIEDGIFKSVENLSVVNGIKDSLITSLKNWKPYNNKITNNDNGVATLQVTTPSRYSSSFIGPTLPIEFKAEHKYYHSFEIKGDKVDMVALYTDGKYQLNKMLTNLQDFQRFSVVHSVSKEFSGTLNYRYETLKYQTGDLWYFRNPLVIDLTDTFGLGKEPSAEQMDSLINKVGVSGFDGEVNLLDGVSLTKLFYVGAEESKKTLANPLLLPKKARLFGHRGMSFYEPENTVPSFLECGKKGVYGIETDVRMTKDGHYVCIHDATVDRTTSGVGKVADMTLEEIRALKITSGANIESHESLKIPTLQEYLDACVITGCVPLIDLYVTAEQMPELIKQVNGIGLESSVLYLTTDIGVMGIVNELSTSIVLGSGGATSDLSVLNQYGIKNFGRNVNTVAYDKYPNAIKNGHKEGMVMGVWNINDVEVAKDFVSRGIDLITTDKIYSLI